jgi:hypothetical protein
MNISSIHTIYPEVVIRGYNYMDGHSIVFIGYGEIVAVIVRIKLHKIIASPNYCFQEFANDL